MRYRARWQSLVSAHYSRKSAAYYFFPRPSFIGNATRISENRIVLFRVKSIYTDENLFFFLVFTYFFVSNRLAYVSTSNNRRRAPYTKFLKGIVDHRFPFYTPSDFLSPTPTQPLLPFDDFGNVVFAFRQISDLFVRLIFFSLFNKPPRRISEKKRGLSSRTHVVLTNRYSQVIKNFTNFNTYRNLYYVYYRVEAHRIFLIVCTYLIYLIYSRIFALLISIPIRISALFSSFRLIIPEHVNYRSISAS